MKVLADGTATLTSRGRGPTLWREFCGAAWYELQADEKQVLAHGHQLSLDSNDPEGAVFTCEAGAAGTGSDDIVQYSEDGVWMWNGAEWVPSGL